MGERVAVELELTNGTRILRNFDPDKCYDFEEQSINKYSFCKSFPFIKRTTRKITKFRYQSVYATHRSRSDSKYSVNCELTTLLHAIKRSVKSWEEILMDGTLRYGDQNE